MELNRDNWKNEHLQKLHDKNYEWCALCLARQKAEEDGTINGGEDLGVLVKDSLNLKDRLR